MIRIEAGALVISVGRAPRLSLRWTLPLLFVLTGCVLPGSALGCFLVVLVHEGGHALLARWRGLAVYEIQVHGMGGHCRHQGGSPLDSAIIAWGGVGAQALLLVAALPVYGLLPSSAFVNSLYYGLIVPNFLMIVLNLIPVAPLDGAEAWALFDRLDARRQRTRAVDAKWKAKDVAMWKTIEAAKRRKRDESDSNDVN